MMSTYPTTYSEPLNHPAAVPRPGPTVPGSSR